MILFVAALLTVGAVAFTVFVRAKDLPEPEPESPTRHLEERKATIYENLRDLQFEYRVGKLSEADYKQTKQDLQRELAAVLAEIDSFVKPQAPAAAKPAPVTPKTSAVPEKPQAAASTVCPRCGASFPKPLKFCGECGKPMMVESR
jgi:cytochrome c-type biogenesis protein CcmI